jgi:hypothetical protein
MWRRRVGKIAYTVIQRTTVPGDFAHAVRRCEVRVGKRAATYAFRSTPERARLPTLRTLNGLIRGARSLAGLQFLRFAQFCCVK